ncbi:MAG: putative nucleotide-binding protein containing TIR-like domain, partial [Solirubrobacteraceae bacterium]|nr:putative nucleotide-binding protein containing TIR-like domain [Solirubrobacteraceae bacterium]
MILEEQADGERTVIEKFEKQALDVGFAVALLTADDMGSVAGSETPKLANRARQN